MQKLSLAVAGLTSLALLFGGCSGEVNNSPLGVWRADQNTEVKLQITDSGSTMQAFFRECLFHGHLRQGDDGRYGFLYSGGPDFYPGECHTVAPDTEDVKHFTMENGKLYMHFKSDREPVPFTRTDEEPIPLG